MCVLACDENTGADQCLRLLSAGLPAARIGPRQMAAVARRMSVIHRVTALQTNWKPPMTKQLARAHYQVGRNAAKAHARGKIHGRVHVGLYELEWRYVLELARGAGVTMSDVIRWAIEADRRHCEKDVFDDGQEPPWSTEANL